MKKILLFIFFPVLGCVGQAFGGTIRHDVDDSLYTGLANDPAYDAVGQVTWNESGQSYLGSATYIGDGWVLTAAHVADGTDFAGGGVSNWTFTVDGTFYQASESFIHPDWEATSGSLTAGWDIALVKLTEDVSDVDPAMLYGGFDGSELGRVVTLVGYGATGDGITGDTEPSGTKRAGQNTIDLIGGTPFGPLSDLTDRIMSVDFDDPNNAVGIPSRLSSTEPLDLEYLTAPGDSGGGSFIDIDSQSYLVGVTSFGQAFDGDIDADYGDLSGLIRVSEFSDWIFDTTGIASVSVVPEPSSLALLAVCVVILLRRRGLHH